MPSAWIERHRTKTGAQRYIVRYTTAGRKSVPRYGGSFKTAREGNARKAWVLGELAAMRVPDLSLLVEPPGAPTLADVAKRWQDSRVDVSGNTRLQHRSAIGHAVPELGGRRVDTLSPADVADLSARRSLQASL